MPNAETASADASRPSLNPNAGDSVVEPKSEGESVASRESDPSKSRASAIEQAVEKGQAPPEASSLTLRGTSRGLEIWVGDEAPQGEALAEELKAQLSQSPDFFSGGDAILHFASKPTKGAIRYLEETAESFDLSVVGVHTASLEPEAKEAKGRLSQRKPASEAPASKYPLPATRFAPAYQEAQEQAKAPTPPMMIPGPVRSGACFEAPGHLVVVGDVNPGAEIRAEGNIVILGSLRGIAHAGTQGNPAFILALKLQPQQLRIGSLIARAGDADNPASGAEIAYAADNMIVVDEYQGRLPFNIANSI